MSYSGYEKLAYAAARAYCTKYIRIIQIYNTYSRVEFYYQFASLMKFLNFELYFYKYLN